MASSCALAQARERLAPPRGDTGSESSSAAGSEDVPRVAPGGVVTHEKAFWRSIVKNNFDPPAGSSLEELSRELSEMLASPDPELRDELGYSILVSWIYQKRLLGHDTLRPLMAEWTANLKRLIGSKDPYAVFRRSFSALMLSVVVARDNVDPILEEHEFRTLLSSALEYLETERDLRGFDARLGWIHATAHTADLLKFLGRSRYLSVADQALILGAIRKKLQGASTVFVAGEDERLARAVLSIVARKDFDLVTFQAWAISSKPVPPTSPLPDVAALRASQNLKNLFAKLEVVLGQADRSSSVDAAEESVRATLKGSF